MPTPNHLDAVATHGECHLDLIETITSPRRHGAAACGLDAIVVSAARPVANLRTAAAVAARLDSRLVVLCSRAAAAAAVADLAGDVPGLRWLAVDVPGGYAHPYFRFDTAAISEAAESQLGDLSVKRNIGLVLARVLGWRSILFLDDDIRAVRLAEVRGGVRALEAFPLVGIPVSRFPDNSVVCHANRLSGGSQGVFISGSTLLVNTSRMRSFFPGVYNEDWLFVFDDVAARSAAAIGSVRQLRYRPFADVRRAANEEFGDVLAEGLVALRRTRAPLHVAMSGEYWRQFLGSRRDFIARAAERLTDRPDAMAAAALAALAAAETRRASIEADVLATFVRAWRDDVNVWRGRLGRLRSVRSPGTALRFLDLDHSTLSDRAAAPAADAPRKEHPMTALTDGDLAVRDAPVAAVDVHPTSRVAPTAQLGAAYRWLQDGEYQRLGRSVVIGAGCDIGHFVVVGEETHIGDGTVLDAYTHVEGGSSVGRNVVVTHRASIGARATIEDNCVVAGLVCERSHVGAGSRVFGDLIHRQLDPSKPWDAPESEEPSPRLGENVFVGWGATVIGGIKIGRGAYICAGATVTKDVDPGVIVTGINRRIEPGEWTGRLAGSEFFGRV